jgi:GNAT superfamily N-acetyltransferase
VTFRIRTAMPADIVVLRDVFRRSSLSNAGDRMNLLANPDALELSDAAVNEGRTRVAVAAGGRIIGFTTCLIAGDAIELDDLFVDPGWMRQGAGRALVLDVMAIARKHGVRRVEVTANPHALVFYEMVGFVFDLQVETRFGPAPRMHHNVVP